MQIFNSLGEAGTQRVRPMAQHTGLSKSRAHRLTQAMVHRGTHPASWLWETAAGRGAGHKQRGFLPPASWDAGGERSWRLTRGHAGVGAGACGEGARLGAGRAGEWRGARDHWRRGRNLLGTSVAGLPGPPPGYLLREAAVDDRSYAPWKALVAKRLEALGAPGRSLVSDRAPALIQRAEPGLECLRMPAVFPLVHAIVERL
ncbi:MAG TPA: helix-turn-helix domain-containing protein [Candidatus Saccharimonadia bacterium]|nr:helix-turn-helix domain-containing protein [Candidatus Saccharimonadia bacterium]